MNAKEDMVAGGLLSPQAPKQKPSVCRMVIYWAYGTPGGEFPVCAPRAAIVTEVHDAEKGDISVCVLNPSGLFFNRVKYSETPVGGTWSWPPRV